MKNIKINKKIAYTLLILISLIIGLIIGIIITNIIKSKEPTPISMNENFIFMNHYENAIYDEQEQKNIVLKTYDEYTKYFDNDILTEKDFNNYNYLIIPITYNGCSESEIVPTEYKIDGKDIEVKITYTASCGLCAPEYMYYLLKIDKELTDVNLSTESKARNKTHCNTEMSYKPIIYLYPETTTEVTINFLKPESLTTTYPKYNNSWKVQADPTGKLIDIDTNRELYSLYWEGNNHQTDMKDEGFVVKGEDTISFLEEKLKLLGLTDREADEFIIYWLPKLEPQEYNYIRFETTEEVNEYMPINVSPQPDTVIRILMDYKPLDEPIKVFEQQIITPQRTGFTLVEWGGSLIE